MTYTKQEAFDTVARHLFAQGCPSVTLEDECAYRGPQGLKCAIGCLIPDSEYTPDMEGKTAPDVCTMHGIARLFDGFDRDFESLLDCLQILHDTVEVSGCDPWRSTSAMRVALNAIAVRHNLSPTILETLSFKDR